MTAKARWRDLDAAVKHSLPVCELALVEQADEPPGRDPSDPRLPGSRVYRFIDIRDRSCWLKVEWDGTGGTRLGERAAGRTDQPMRFWAVSGLFGDRAAEARLVKVVTERLSVLRTREW